MKTAEPVLTQPPAQGLYDPRNEHDACGVGFVAHIKNHKSHAIVQQGLEILDHLTHRGAVGADPAAGDGAGILIQIPDDFLRQECANLGIDLPTAGEYGVAMVSLPQKPENQQRCIAALEKTILDKDQLLLGWREVPTDRDAAKLPKSVISCEPCIRQLFIARGPNTRDQDEFERKLFVIRKMVETRIRVMAFKDVANFYIASLSTRTLVYKGMFLSYQISSYYTDLQNPQLRSALALVHQRFSTNTFPAWELAHPFRMIAHNGEINTLRGNINWMAARKNSISSEILGDDLDDIWPLIVQGKSDSACFDNALELLVMGGYSLGHAMMLMIPEAWADNPLMDEKRRAFYEYHAALMEPWDGPAGVAFTDGRQIGATLDRNGLRPARYIVTDDDLVVMASEVGVLPIPEQRIVKKWRLQPGKMFLIDLEQGRIIDDTELKSDLANARPYQSWLAASQIRIENLPAEVAALPPDPETMLERQQAFGYTQEDLKFLMAPTAANGQEPTGSMGNDTPLAIFSVRPRPLNHYFKQLFAQVTNPAIDPIREQLVMSLISIIGPRPNLLNLQASEPQMRLEVEQPILCNEDLEKIRAIADHTNNRFRTITLSLTFPASDGASGLEPALKTLCEQAEQAVRSKYNIIILSDRDVDRDHAPIPSLLGTSAVHHHLIRSGLRTETGLVVETGSAREVHHFALLAGYGAEVINPYLAFETVADMHHQRLLPTGIDEEEAVNRYVRGINKGLLKVMSKMGISTYQSYCGSQIFEAIGLGKEFIDKYFTGTAAPIDGAGIAEISREVMERHHRAYGDHQLYRHHLDTGGGYAWRLRGEKHNWTPETVSLLQHATRANDKTVFRRFSNQINTQNEELLTLRGMFRIKKSTQPVPLDEVEPANEIVKRFSTGAMSFGSISHEAHSTIAIAMNRLGGKSNTGEGGEEASRFKPLPNGDSMRSAIKQVASGRFGVTTEYLVNADEIQIKIAQGAKPGEGGQLPGYKVNKIIGRVRHSTPGVSLISPPPHHDIYSIEDLAQLIFDLKNTNPDAAISVKLVSEIGIGTIAAGVVKAHADHVVVAGHDGGTGASPLTSIKHAGAPWELGLAETQQTLVLNQLRGRTRLLADGQMRTGRDVVIAALLGADEVGFGTAALVVCGCIMMRKCHLNTCPVGVATQNPELRKRFTGKADYLVNYFMFVAEEVRALMAELGFRNFDQMIGQTDCLDIHKATDHWKAHGVDVSHLLHRPDVPDNTALHAREKQNHGIDAVLDHQLILKAKSALDEQKSVKIESSIRNTDRTVGAMLSGCVAKRYGHAGLSEDTIYIKFKGTAGQSFGAWLAHGITLELQGDANDYVGKGLSGGRIMIYPPASSPIIPEDNIIIGNTVLYGAISGECYFRGVAGERFAVRNSGAIAVVEGVGDHGCEYMTGGTVVVLGETGRNFAAGMSGGIAYVLDVQDRFSQYCNTTQVQLQSITTGSDTEYPEDTETTAGSLLIQHQADQDDALILYQLIQRHRHYTGSEKAQEIMDNWTYYVAKFIKVMPIDYHKALLEMAATQAVNNDVEELNNG